MEETSDTYSKEVLALAENPEHFGRLNDPTASAYLKGICGDDMEFYIVLKHDTSAPENKIIEDIKFYTQTGCEATKACGSTMSRLAIGKSIDDAMGISPKKILETLNYGLPENHRHCAILAVSAFYKAVACYLIEYHMS